MLEHLSGKRNLALPSEFTQIVAMISSVPSKSLRIIVLGATGTIGRAAVRALLGRGHEVVCFVRPQASIVCLSPSFGTTDGPAAAIRFGDITDPQSLMREGIGGEHFDVLLSCMASRTGIPEDAWSIDYQAHIHALEACKMADIGHMVLISAICVQKPRLAFQFAKLAFEKALRESGIGHTIIRPTAYFKSLCGQVDRVKRGKPFLVFGDGRLTSCKPISDRDLAEFVCDCLVDRRHRGGVLPIGGPGEAITPRQQAECLFGLMGKPLRIREVPVALLSGIAAGLGIMGRLVPPLVRKAELARIGRYYATESMLLLNEHGFYDADLTPATGSDTLFELYARLIHGETSPELRDHAVF